MTLRQLRGLLRSLVMYHATPWRNRRLRTFYASFVRPGQLCFDVGAHVGGRVRVWRALGARVVALEPQPRCMDWLRRGYGRDEEVILLEMAVGEREGSLPLLVSDRTPTVTTLSREWAATVSKADSFANVTWDREVEVPVTTLDALIRRYGEPAFCKIDVEGFEPQVLAGLSRPLAALSFEYIPAALDGALACLERLEALGHYEFNRSPGESHRWAEARWLSGGEMADRLRALGPGDDSGDVYARRVD